MSLSPELLDAAATEAVRAGAFAKGSVTEMGKFNALLDQLQAERAELADLYEWLRTAPESDPAMSQLLALFPALRRHRIAVASAPVDPPGGPTASLSLSTSVNHAGGVITATPTFAAASGETITTATLGLYTTGGALLEDAGAITSGVAVPFGLQPNGSYVVKLAVTQSNQQAKAAQATCAINSTASANLVVFSDPKVGRVLSPLTIMGPGYFATPESALDSVDMSVNPAPWYDYNLAHAGLTLGQSLPQKPLKDLFGTVSVSPGSTIVTGVGTSFLSEVGSGNRIATQDGAGTWLSVPSALVKSVESDTSLTLAVAWTGSALTGVPASTSRSSVTGNGAVSYWSGYSNYYDYALCAYQQYHRLRDVDPAEAAKWQAVARTAAETWWGTTHGNGAPGSGTGLEISPRGMAVGGILLRALEEDEAAGVPGTSLKWDWIYSIVSGHWKNWVYNRRTYPSLHYGARDPGYAVLETARLAALLPDTYPKSDGSGTLTDGAAKRATLLAQLIEVTVGTGVDVPNSYYRRIQTVPAAAIGDCFQVGGLWVWSDDAPWDRFGYFNEPWHMGLLMEGFVFLHRYLVSLGGYAAEAAEVKAMILEATDAAYQLGWAKTAGVVMKGPTTPLDGTTTYRDFTYAVNNDQMPPNDLGELAGTLTLTPGSAVVPGTGSQLVTDGLAHGERIRFYRPLTGTLALTNGSAAIVGTGTLFLSELVPGEMITIRAESTSSSWGTVYARVETITSDTALTLSFVTDRMTGSGLTFWREVFNHLPGTVSATNGSAILTGTGTAFLSRFAAVPTADKPGYIWVNTVEDQVKNGIQSHAFAWRRLKILSVDSNTQITLTAAFKYITRSDLRYSNTQGGDYVIATASAGSLTLLSPIVDTAPQTASVSGGGWKVHRKWQGGPSYLAGGWDTNSVRETRQNTPTALHMFGYAYALTGNTKYLAWGDEMMASTFGKGHGPSADPYYSLADFTNDGDGQRGKEFNQNYRTTGHYLGYRMGGT